MSESYFISVRRFDVSTGWSNWSKFNYVYDDIFPTFAEARMAAAERGLDSDDSVDFKIVRI